MAKGNRPKSGQGNELVPYDQWGPPLNHTWGNEPIEEEGEGWRSVTEDEQRYITEPYDEPLTKTAAIAAVRSFRNDDGTYGDDDYSVYAAYEDGTVFSSGWEEAGGNWRKRFTTRGLIGISVSTPDDEYVWGEDWAGSGANKHRTPMQTWSEDGESGKTNTHSGYRSTGVYWVRVKTTYRSGQRYPERETVRRSAVGHPDWLR